MQKDKDRFLQMPKVFDKMAPYLVPHYNFLQESIYDIINFENDKSFSFVDLGGGSGIQIEKVLKRYPNSKAVYIDSSEPFIEIAKKRLEQFEGRVHFITKNMESDWECDIDTEPELIFSMSAIHHLEALEKKQLYQLAYKVLRKDGWFFNIDEMRSPDLNAYKNDMIFWSTYVKNAINFIPSELYEYYQEWNKHFDGWKIRNIDTITIPQKKGDDIHETFEIQLDYLKSAGFHNTDLYIKFRLWCVIGGQK